MILLPIFRPAGTVADLNRLKIILYLWSRRMNTKIWLEQTLPESNLNQSRRDDIVVEKALLFEPGPVGTKYTSKTIEGCTSLLI